MLLIDSNIAIHLRDGDAAVLARVEAVEERIALSIVTWIELEGGVNQQPISSMSRRRALDQMLQAYDILPFRSADALAYRHIVETLGFSRAKTLDRMIAAQAIVADAPLATVNVRDFRAIPRLRLLDWSNREATSGSPH